MDTIDRPTMLAARKPISVMTKIATSRPKPGRANGR